jgi:predicted ATPase
VEGVASSDPVSVADALVPFPSPKTSAKEPRRRSGRSSSQQRPGYLPSPPTPLVGRVREIQSVESQLRGDGALGIQLLTLVGPPGTGKTRLAIAAADRLASSYEHGVYFVDLGAVREVDGAAAAIAHRIGATYRSGRPTALDETLKRWFKARRVLLVLDNFEGVLQAADLVEDLLTNCPYLRVLATSRAPLRTGREHRLEVAPLATPTLDSSQPAAVLLRFEAVQLFVSRVQALRSDWNLTETNARAVAEICVRLDGLPLAIELAASWMNVLSPQALLKELPHSIIRLEGHAGSSGRHQTLDEMIGWSYELLSDSERRLFQRLSVFENGWTIDTAFAVCAEPDQSRADVLSLLGSLVDKHLVVRRESTDGSVRFGFLQTIHGYAVARLDELGQLPEIRSRHAAAIAELCEHAERELNGPLQADWIEVLEQERGNIQAALSWAVMTGQVSAVELGLRIAATLWLFWDVRGHVQEGRQPLRELLQVPAAQTPGE